MTTLRAFVCFMLVTSTSAVYEIQGHLVCGTGPESYKITTDHADGQVWVQLYYMERNAYQTYCTPFHVGGHVYGDADKINVGNVKGLQCINQCIDRSEMYNQINAVTFYHGHSGCYCVKERHYDTTAGMSTCNIKRHNDMMIVNRTKHGSRVSRNGKQMHSLSNDDNFIHLEGSAGRTDHAFWIMVKVSNYQCNGNTWHTPAPREVTLGKRWEYGTGHVVWSEVNLGKLVLLGKITITSSGRGSKRDSVYKVETRRSDDPPQRYDCTTFSYAAGDRSKEVKCKEMTMAIWVRMERTVGNRPLRDFTVKVYEAELTQLLNVASKKLTWTSNQRHYSTGAEAIDGNYDTYIQATTTDLPSESFELTHPTFWSVDLKEVITIRKIIIYLNKQFYRSEGSYTHMKVLTNRWNFVKHLDSTPASWTVCKEVGKDLNFVGANPIVRTEVTCDKTTRARTVRIQNQNGLSLYLNEVEVIEDAMWFRPPYDCFDTLTSKFGCKDLTFNLDTGTVTKTRSTGGKTHMAAEAERGYYTIHNKMFDGDLFAGYIYPGDSRQNPPYKVARVQTLAYTNRKHGDVLLWQIVKEGSGAKSESGNDYYKIISKDTGKPLYAVPEFRYDNIGNIKSHAVEVGNRRYTPQGDRELWEFVKQGDGYYKIMNKDLKKPMYGTQEAISSAQVADSTYNYISNGKEVWDIEKV